VIYVALGITPQNVTSINPDIMTTVTQGLDALGNGKLIGITGSSEIYVVNNNQLLGIPDQLHLIVMGLIGVIYIICQ